MKRDLEYFIHERAQHLAVVHLTRRQDLAIERMKPDSGLDMLVTILRDNLPTGRIFGVEVKGQDRAFKNSEEISKHFSPTENNYFQDFPFPVCALFFSMENDQGYYKWIIYPGGANKSARLAEPSQWYFLNEDRVDQIVSEVNAWYDDKSRSVA